MLCSSSFRVKPEYYIEYEANHKHKLCGPSIACDFFLIIIQYKQKKI